MPTRLIPCASRDPLLRLRALLETRGADIEFFEGLDSECDAFGERVRSACRAIGDPRLDETFENTSRRTTRARRRRVRRFRRRIIAPRPRDVIVLTMSLGAAINAGLRAAMEADDRVVLMGEDIGTLGGVFRVTDGLQQRFGRRRVVDTPLAESGIVGTAIGLALRGYRPVCEIQFDGSVYPGFDQIVSQLAKMRARSNGRIALPIVIRIPMGGGIGAVEHHSESNEAYFAHRPGLRVVACADANDAYHMIQQSIRSNDPVIFYEPKQPDWRESEVDETLTERMERPRLRRHGTDCTLVAYRPHRRHRDGDR